MYKQFSKGCRHLSLWHIHERFLHQEKQPLRPISLALYRKQRSLQWYYLILMSIILPILELEVRFIPRTHKQSSHNPTVMDRTTPPPPGFLICCNISKRFCIEWKAFDLLSKIKYILRVVALLKVYDITKRGCHLGFSQKLEVR